jgi:hypothetical protein
MMGDFQMSSLVFGMNVASNGERRSMPKAHFHLLIVFAALIVAVIAAGPYSGGGKLLALQQGSTPSGSVSGSDQTNTGAGTPTSPDTDKGVNPNNSAGPTSEGNYVGPGSRSGQQNGGQMPAGPDAYGQGTQANNEVARAAAPWGWIIGSFIVGLIVGGLAFRRTVYRDRIDRTDIRRSA